MRMIAPRHHRYMHGARRALAPDGADSEVDVFEPEAMSGQVEREFSRRDPAQRQFYCFIAVTSAGPECNPARQQLAQRELSDGCARRRTKEFRSCE